MKKQETKTPNQRIAEAFQVTDWLIERAQELSNPSPKDRRWK